MRSSTVQKGLTESLSISPAAAAGSAVSRVLVEDVLTLSEARAELFRITGRRPDKATLTRWIHRGVGGTQLDAVRLGRQLFTSRQALTRFIESRTAKSIGDQPVSRGSSR